jgi:rhamnogalacturonyl hydrolase YesR
MHIRQTLLTALAVAAIAGVAPAKSVTDTALPNRADVLSTIERTAAAEIVRMKAFEQNPSSTSAGRNIYDSNWISATFFVGATRLARVSSNPEFFMYPAHIADIAHHALRGNGTPVALLNADNQAIGDLYEEIYARRRQPGSLMPLKQRLDFAVPYLTTTPSPQKLVWWWCDAMFMAPPVFARMSALTGDPKYLHAMDMAWWRTYDRLWDAKEHLYFRDERFVARRSANGKKIFWSRGNGWVMAGIARVLESMPADYPSRARYETLFREMAASVAKLQGKDGLWRASLLDTKAFPEAESSGTAFFTYALAFGINHGLLDRKTYLPHVVRGWAGLNRMLLPEGIPGSVQSGGDQPVHTKPDNPGLYASGAFVLAGLEVTNLDRAPTPLPLAEPEQDPRFAALPPPARPTGTTPAEMAESQRWAAERKAMAELPYNPETDDPHWRSPVLGPPPPTREKTVKLVPAAPADREPRALVRFVPERADDIFWENDRVAQRIYGPALEAREPPSSSGIDVWVKSVRWPFMDRQLKTVTYHLDQGEGHDSYNVGASRGMGGLGIWSDNKLWTSRNFKRFEILKDGPDVAAFRVDYAPWPVGTERKVSETRSFALPLGTNLTRMVSTISSDSAEPLIVGIGLAKKATIPGAGVLLADKEKGIIAFWEPTDPDHGTIGTAVLVDPASVVDIRGDADNWLILIKATPGKPFVYYAGSVWDQGLDFHSRQEWEAYLRAQKLSFDPTRNDSRP